ncbi:unnamed protein product [Vitrella brassicaformis CCMP3155]|uniref:RING-type domain-containing protein n=2 Tax=Vitrella brassicaformis TaxID=1169539 RepID=A0A0G4G2J4_VITBC|nr:unnamed protein product [Vitrella brassicaformis CCMP3155]|eukprot:CEM22078.1 unnamed protein product [Vitrella brassicaformis CCMP3155]
MCLAALTTWRRQYVEHSTAGVSQQRQDTVFQDQCDMSIVHGLIVPCLVVYGYDAIFLAFGGFYVVALYGSEDIFLVWDLLAFIAFGLTVGNKNRPPQPHVPFPFDGAGLRSTVINFLACAYLVWFVLRVCGSLYSLTDSTLFYLDTTRGPAHHLLGLAMRQFLTMEGGNSLGNGELGGATRLRVTPFILVYFPLVWSVHVACGVWCLLQTASLFFGTSDVIVNICAFGTAAAYVWATMSSHVLPGGGFHQNCSLGLTYLFSCPHEAHEGYRVFVSLLAAGYLWWFVLDQGWALYLHCAQATDVEGENEQQQQQGSSEETAPVSEPTPATQPDSVSLSCQQSSAAVGVATKSQKRRERKARRRAGVATQESNESRQIGSAALSAIDESLAVVEEGEFSLEGTTVTTDNTTPEPCHPARPEETAGLPPPPLLPSPAHDDTPSDHAVPTTASMTPEEAFPPSPRETRHSHSLNEALLLPGSAAADETAKPLCAVSCAPSALTPPWPERMAESMSDGGRQMGSAVSPVIDEFVASAEDGNGQEDPMVTADSTTREPCQPPPLGTSCQSSFEDTADLATPSLLTSDQGDFTTGSATPEESQPATYWNERTGLFPSFFLPNSAAADDFPPVAAPMSSFPCAAVTPPQLATDDETANGDINTASPPPSHQRSGRRRGRRRSGKQPTKGDAATQTWRRTWVPRGDSASSSDPQTDAMERGWACFSAWAGEEQLTEGAEGQGDATGDEVAAPSSSSVDLGGGAVDIDGGVYDAARGEGGVLAAEASSSVSERPPSAGPPAVVEPTVEPAMASDDEGNAMVAGDIYDGQVHFAVSVWDHIAAPAAVRQPQQVGEIVLPSADFPALPSQQPSASVAMQPSQPPLDSGMAGGSPAAAPQHHESQDVNEPAEEPEPAAEDNKAAKCVVCLSNTPTELCFPCGHTSLCEGCRKVHESYYLSHGCPYCDSDVQMLVHVQTPC